MRRSTRRSTMGVSIHSSLDFESKRVNTRRSSSILPQFEDTQILVEKFTTKFSMSSFVKKVNELTPSQITAIERVGFGNLLRVHHHTLRKNLLLEWLERWDCDKRAFVLLDRELTITNIDAALILGLRTTGNPVSFSEETPLSELEEEYGATLSSRKISISVIEQRLQSLGDVASEDFVRTFLLFIFGTLLFPSSVAKVDSRYLLLLKDLDSVSEYAWGMAVVEDLFNCLSRRKEGQIKSVEGCLILLQIWSYEHIDIGRPNLLSGSVDFPRACRWESSRCNTPRQFFTTKFNEVEDNQVAWKLQPTSTETNIDVIQELLVKEFTGEEIIVTCTKTTTATKVPFKDVSRHAVLDEESEGAAGRGKHDKQVDIPDDSGGSSEISSLVEEIEGEEVLSTRARTTTSVTIGLPPKSYSRHATLDKEPYRGMGRSKHDTLAAVSEDSRQSTDMSGITEDYTECSSSYNLQEDQFEETSHCVKGKSALKTEKSEVNGMVELERENAMLRKEIENLRKEVADLKENQHLRAPLSVDNIDKIIDEYYAEFPDPLEVIYLR